MIWYGDDVGVLRIWRWISNGDDVRVLRIWGWYDTVMMLGFWGFEDELVTVVMLGCWGFEDDMIRWRCWGVEDLRMIWYGDDVGVLRIWGWYDTVTMLGCWGFEDDMIRWRCWGDECLFGSRWYMWISGWWITDSLSFAMHRCCYGIEWNFHASSAVVAVEATSPLWETELRTADQKERTRNFRAIQLTRNSFNVSFDAFETCRLDPCVLVYFFWWFCRMLRISWNRTPFEHTWAGVCARPARFRSDCQKWTTSNSSKHTQTFWT